MPLLGEAIARWLGEHIDPELVYDHEVLSDLSEVGITYDASSHQMWLATGELVEVKTYSPAELVKHPTVQFTGLSEPIETRWVPGFEIAHWLHLLVWPTEEPPGMKAKHWRKAFERDVASIAERGALPYRQGVM